MLLAVYQKGKIVDVDRRREIRERANAATKGPWIDWDFTGDPCGEPGLVSGTTVVIAPQNLTDDDREFVKNARQDVPDLLDEIERIRVLLERCLPEIDSYLETPGIASVEAALQRLKFDICYALDHGGGADQT